MSDHAPENATLPPGVVIGAYKVLRPLGQGGMGVVYAAEDQRLGRKVALKLLTSDAVGKGHRLQRFFQEARTVSALNHPGIVTIYEAGESEYGPFIAMELIEGHTLRHRPAAGFPLPELYRIIEQLARALAAAHDANVVHRDLKPDNVMLRADGYIKILDFGLARLVDAADVDVTKTAAGVVAGTLRYMSPEQVQGHDVWTSSDIFSLGLLVYELATGRHPFRDDRGLGIVQAILSASPVAPSRLNAEIPQEFEALLLRMLDQDPARRPSASDVAAEIQALSSQRGQVRPASASTRPSTYVGRDRELGLLAAAFAKVERGEPAMVLVTGDAGAGKSALVERFLADLRANAPACRIGRGQCQERLAGTGALLPVLEVLDMLVRGPGGPDIVRGMKAVAPSWVMQLTSVSGSIPTPEEIGRLSPERMKRELVALFQEAGRRGPVVLVIEDLHWVDPATLDLLTYLVGRADLPMLTVGTARPAEIALSKHPFGALKLDLQTRGVCQEVAMDRLTRANIDAYLSAAFPHHDLPASFGDLIERRTEGHALFMVDLVAYFKEKGAVVQVDDRWRFQPELLEGEQALPQSVASMVDRKIERLDESDRKALVAASVQGVEFDVAIVAAAMGTDAADLEEQLDRIAKAHGLVVLTEEYELPNRTLTARYRFGHALYHASLYGSLRPARRASLSRAMAEALVDAYGTQAATRIPSELADLFETARDFERAADFFLAAAGAASRVFAHRTAADLAARGLAALEALPPGPGRDAKELSLQLARGIAMVALQSFASAAVAEAYARAKQLSEQLGIPQVEFGVRYGLVWCYMCQGRSADALANAEACVALAAALGHSAFVAEAHLARGIVLAERGDYRAAAEDFKATLAVYNVKEHAGLAVHFGSDPGVHAGMDLARVLFMMGKVSESSEVMATTSALARTVGDPTSLCLLYFRRIELALQNEALDEAQSDLDACVRLGEQHNQSILIWCPFHQGHITSLRGDIDTGVALMMQSITTGQAVGMRYGAPAMLSMVARMHLKAGRHEEAAAVADRALAEAEAINEGFAIPVLRMARGLARAAAGGAANFAGAMDDLRHAFDDAERRDAASDMLMVATAWAPLLASANRTDEARTVLSDAIARYANEPASTKVVAAQALLVSLTEPS